MPEETEWNRKRGGAMKYVFTIPQIQASDWLPTWKTLALATVLLELIKSLETRKKIILSITKKMIPLKITTFITLFLFQHLIRKQKTTLNDYDSPIDRIQAKHRCRFFINIWGFKDVKKQNRTFA